MYRLRFKLLLLPLLIVLSACSDSPPPPPYSAAIAEGRAAAKEVMDETGATALSVALTDGDRIVWSESFGVTDKTTGKVVTPSTMIGIGSVSKMFATIATMILVDRGKISLEEPVATYITGFSMLSPEYKDITVRMLLNHSSGLPGGNLRDAGTAAPFTGFAAQVMDDLKYQRLKHTPGYMSVYCNDGFTMLENLVKVVTGTSYPEFVQQEILTPLGMTNSRYALLKFPDGSYAKPHSGEVPMVEFYLNFYATGGVYSTAEDMMHLAAMLMNGGAYGSKQILSKSSIAAMAQDQTLGSFNPLPTDAVRFGLGWDTVSEAGLSVVGIKGWQKGGDVSGIYGATFIIAPDEKLAVAVMGASNKMGSSKAAKIAERILLSALVERGRVVAMPLPLDIKKALPVQSPTLEEKTAYSGDYAGSGTLRRVTFAGDDSLAITQYADGAWQPWKQGLKLRNDGWYATDADSASAYRFISRAGRIYLAERSISGAGYYTDQFLYGQKLVAKAPLSQSWKTRVTEKWLLVNGDETSTPYLSLKYTDLLEGFLSADSKILCDMTPAEDGRLNGMNLLIPQVNGRDLSDLAVDSVNQEWLRFGSSLYRPLSKLENLSPGRTTVTIGSSRFAEWRAIPLSGTLTITGSRAWTLLGADLATVASGAETGSTKLPDIGIKYLVLYGSPGTSITIDIN